MDSHLTSSPIRPWMAHWSVFSAGVAAMAVAGYILVEGMLKFGGDSGTRGVFIAAGIVFQISETVCFVSFASMTRKSMYWRTVLFALGALLFAFSIGVMTLAQKATLFTGEQQNRAIEQQITGLNAQIDSLSRMIDSYRLNAEKQSQSIYADSREKGQDSLNRASKLEEDKVQLLSQLFALNQAKQQTSSEFFKHIELVTGWPALQTEFYFLVARSLLLELCGIVLMAFSAHLISAGHGQKKIAPEPAANRFPQLSPENPRSNKKPKLAGGPQSDTASWAAKYINALREQTGQKSPEEAQYDALLLKVIEMYQAGQLKSLRPQAIIDALLAHSSEPIPTSMAQTIERLAKQRLQIE